MQWHRLEMQGRENLFNSDTAPIHDGDDDHRSQVNFSGRLPSWLWAVVAAILGISSHGRKWRYAVATFLHVMTVIAGLMFAACGMFFNVFDILSELTKTTVLVGICKCVLGAYWIGMGIYAHSLAGRLFSNPRFVECIRMHSKTVFKVNTALIIFVLSVAVVVSHMYWTRNLLDYTADSEASNATRVRDGNCATAHVDILVCQLYYVSRLVYSVFNLLWNLLVASILLSVCRTHTICIRRFMKELLYDTKIYEEFLMLQAFGPRPSLVEESIAQSDRVKVMTTIRESHIWDDDINEFDREDDSDRRPPENASILQSMRSMRVGTFDAGGAFGQSMNVFGSSQGLDNYAGPSVQESWSAEDNFPTHHFYTHSGEEFHQDQTTPPFLRFQHVAPATATPAATTTTGTAASTPAATTTGTGASTTTAATTQRSSSNTRKRLNTEKSRSSSAGGPANPTQENPGIQDEETFEASGQSAEFTPVTGAHGAPFQKFVNGKPPIMSNEDLLFTYFQLVRRLSSTSRLLQRWMSTLITFTLMWCTLLIIYWTTHTADWLGLFEFIVPLLILFLLSSAYAEVNFEGERLLKAVLPTLERMSVVYYMQSAPLELKVFSFTLSYNTITTVVAGVALTFATRIILEQIWYYCLHQQNYFSL